MKREIVQEARAWLGTPYLHQASTKAAGTDCLGLLRGVWREALGSEPETPPPYSQDWDEVSRRDVLLIACQRLLVERPVDQAEPGDVILFRMRTGSVAKHLGLISALQPTRFIHAYSRHGVVESALSEPWARRITGVFAFPGAD